jgi:hypothetical protein
MIFLLVTGMMAGLSACLPGNAPLGPEQFDVVGDALAFEVEVSREAVFAIVGGERQPISAAEPVTVLENGYGLAVDENGRAITRLDDRVTLELLRGAELLQIQHVSDRQGSGVSVAQGGGVLIADLTTRPDVANSLTIQTAFGEVVARNARLSVVRERNSPLEWVMVLEANGPSDVVITSAGGTETLSAGQARWMTSIGTPGPPVVINEAAQEWLAGARDNIEQPELGTVLLPTADLVADTSSLSSLPQLGQAVEFDRTVNGAVNLMLDPVGIFGSPGYALEDCNSDGVSDLAIRDGIVRLDFEPLLARVQAVDVTLLNRAEPGKGVLQAYDPAGISVAQQQIAGQPGELELLSLRSDSPYHAAQLTLSNACLLGISLTPPIDGVPGEPRVSVQPVQNEVVVNVLGSTAAREGAQLQAMRVGATPPGIDGRLDDWDTLARKNGLAWQPIPHIVYDSVCSTRFPGNESNTDFAGQVLFAYDDQYLYVAFQVVDDGLVPYSGDDLRFFLGDSAQLLLDLDLNGDFDTPALSGDDVQIDLLPRLDLPQAALWQLSTLTSSQLTAARVVVSPTASGYILEAAVPWQSLNVAPSPGDRLGLVAAIHDNDTPALNTQECILTTEPERDWRDPTTWGTILLAPVAAE